MASCEKSQKILHTLQKLTCLRFMLNRNSVYLSLICGKQIITKHVQRGMLSGGTLSFCKPFFRNRKCLLWTALSKFVYNISE